MKEYCVQNDNRCESCSLVNYGLDCMNNPVNTDIEVTLKLPQGLWVEYSLQALKMGFTGQEFLTLAFLFDAETEIELSRFAELDNIPEWAFERLDKHLKENYPIVYSDHKNKSDLS